MSHGSDSLLHPTPAPAPAPGRPARRAWLTWALYALAVALLAACVWVGYAHIQAGWEKLRHASPGDIGLMLGAIAANIVLDGIVFWLVLIPFKPRRPVGLTEMTALIAATSLLNYLPMRAGMIGRSAYLKHQHAVAYRVSVVLILAIAAWTSAIYLLLGALTIWRKQLDPAWWVGAALGLLLLAILSIEALRYSRRWAPRRLWRYFDDAHQAITWLSQRGFVGFAGTWLMLVLRAAGLGARVIVLSTAARIFGTPIGAGTALLFAACGTYATMLAPLPNGLGLRESIYGLMAQAGLAGSTLPDGATGLALGLIERAVEAIVFVVLGTLGLLYVRHAPQKTNPRHDNPNPTNPNC